MRREDAFDGEMGFPRRLSREQQERLLAGAPFTDGGELDQTAAFVRALPALVREQPDEVLTAALVPRLAAAARSSAVEAERAPTVARRPARSRTMLVARVAVAVALLPAVMAGLAFAGVTLPQPAQDAFDRVGVDLPNQSAVDEEPAAGDGDGAGVAGEKGSETAEQKRQHGTKKSNPARAQGRGHGARGRGRALGKRGLAPGRTGAVGNSGGNNAGGQGKSRAEAQSGGKARGSGRKSPPPQARKPVIPTGQAKGKVK